jgi:hypothetical protein
MAFVETDIPPGPNRTSVVENIQTYAASKGAALNEDQAINVLAFHNKLRALNNDMFGATSLSDSFETRRKGFARLASGANELADAIPFGSFVKPFTLAAKVISGTLQDREQEKIFASYEILNPSHDAAVSAATSRALADRFSEENIAAISACKSEKEAQALSVKCYAEMIEVLATKQEEMKATYKDIACGRESGDALISLVCKSSGVEATHEKEGHHFQDEVLAQRAHHHNLAQVH